MKTRFETDRENPKHMREAHISWKQLGATIALSAASFALPTSSPPPKSHTNAHQSTGTDHLVPTFSSANSYGGRLRAFVQDCRKALDNRERVVIVTAQARRMAEVLGDEIDPA